MYWETSADTRHQATLGSICSMFAVQRRQEVSEPFKLTHCWSTFSSLAAESDAGLLQKLSELILTTKAVSWWDGIPNQGAPSLATRHMLGTAFWKCSSPSAAFRNSSGAGKNLTKCWLLLASTGRLGSDSCITARPRLGSPKCPSKFNSPVFLQVGKDVLQKVFHGKR